MKNSTVSRGILVHVATAPQITDVIDEIVHWFSGLGIADFTLLQAVTRSDGMHISCALLPHLSTQWFPDFNTGGLNAALALETVSNEVDLVREILLCMLVSPIEFQYPSFAELQAAVHVRRNIVQAARRTALAFDTVAAERPAEYWRYTEGHGFTLLSGTRLQDALEKATQPESSKSLYSFSCYRATEYVILLGIVKELASCNRNLLTKLEKHWQRSPVMSARFHESFLIEYGTMEQPVPQKYYVPGDRVWFRNPDPISSEITGYEGSWVIYLGGGLFSDFWRIGNTFTLDSKCLEVYHWRHGAWKDSNGQWSMDEAAVERRVQISQDDKSQMQEILAVMMRYRDPRGVSDQGGCLDTTREYSRFICPGTANITLPDIPESHI
ncbi:MAG: hypothetical protein IPJ18_05560 [Betaproteobacteria bacterium]|nr:hypothetical protein [Betaproteobacteria bacterium]